MIVYTLGAYLNEMPVYFSGMKPDGTLCFSDDIEDTEFGNRKDIEKLKRLLEEEGSQFGPYEIIQVEFTDDDDVIEIIED